MDMMLSFFGDVKRIADALERISQQGAGQQVLPVIPVAEKQEVAEPEVEKRKRRTKAEMEEARKLEAVPVEVPKAAPEVKEEPKAAPEPEAPAEVKDKYFEYADFKADVEKQIERVGADLVRETLAGNASVKQLVATGTKLSLQLIPIKEREAFMETLKKLNRAAEGVL
jgi:hypothetical protein